MFEECPKCGNLMTTIQEMETGICMSCGWFIEDDPEEEDEKSTDDEEWECPYCGSPKAAIGIGCRTEGCQGCYD